MPQSLSSILIHLVFSTKHREPFITPDVEADLHDYMGGIFRRCECPSLLIGGTADHVHALFVLSRTKTVASVVEDVKSSSSKWIKAKGGLWQHFYWQAGYGAFSVSQSGLEKVKSYIANQKQHHGQTTFQDEYRLLCKKYGVEIDEQYVWD
jgi:putative transposase